MTHITIQPPLAHAAASRLKQANDQLDGIRSGLRGQWSRLSATWEGRGKHSVEASVYSAFDDLARLSDRMYDLGVRLEAIARRFEDADENVPFLLPRMTWNEIVAALIGFLPGIFPLPLPFPKLPWPFSPLPVIPFLPLLPSLPAIIGQIWPPKISIPPWLPIQPAPLRPTPVPAPTPVQPAQPAPVQPAQPLRPAGIGSIDIGLKQTDPRWAKDPMGPGGTIGLYGCTITSIAMIARYYGTDVTTQDINNWLREHGGYTDGSNLVWGKADEYLREVLGRDGSLQGVAATSDAIDGQLTAGNPVILHIPSKENPKDGHWVLAVPPPKNDGTFTAYDPLTGTTTAIDIGRVTEAKSYR